MRAGIIPQIVAGSVASSCWNNIHSFGSNGNQHSNKQMHQSYSCSTWNQQPSDAAADAEQGQHHACAKTLFGSEVYRYQPPGINLQYTWQQATAALKQH
jgi:hypothetical protein